MKTTQASTALEQQKSMTLVQNALEHHKAGKYVQASRLYQKALKKDPSNVAALNFMSDAMLMQKKPRRAAQYAQRALSLKPEMAGALCILGKSLHLLGELEQSIENLEKAVTIQPDYVDALLNLGNVLSDSGKNQRAIAIYETLLEAAPGFAHGYYNLGNACRRDDLLPEALEAYENATRLDPGYEAAHANAAGILIKLGNVEAGIEKAEKALALNPRLVSALTSKGHGHRYQGRLDIAENCYRDALIHSPDDAGLHEVLGTTLQEQGRLEEALQCHEQALRLEPGFAQAQNALGTCQLAMGDLETGWHNYEARLEIAAPDALREFPFMERWQGESLKDKTLLVWKEQQVSDDLVFSSCFADLIARVHSEGGRCVLETDPRLVALYARSFGDDRVTVEEEGANTYAKNMDFHLPAGSLPLHFRRTLSDFPARTGYLKPDLEALEQWQGWLATLPGTIRAGFAWAPQETGVDGDAFFPLLEAWKPLLEKPGLSLINMQPGVRAQDINAINQHLPSRILHAPDMDMCDDLDGVAALTAALDYVVTPHTWIAHLAGALGVPVLTFGRAFSCLSLGTEGLPWYPGVHFLAHAWDEKQETVSRRIASKAARLP